MIPNPIVKVLSTLATRRVQSLLMGGQACVFYGAAEFSRDCDVALLAEPENLARLQTALADLEAEEIAVPPFAVEYLARGHAVHFRCHAEEARGMRLDVMTVMRGVAPFATLWERRTTLGDDAGLVVDLMGLEDLIAAKKTQCDKDWPMIRRLIESHYAIHAENPPPEQVEFWLRQSRTPEMLIEIAARFPDFVAAAATVRPLVAEALHASRSRLAQALAEEQQAEMEADRAYWAPLKRELEQLRRRRRS